MTIQAYQYVPPDTSLMQAFNVTEEEVLLNRNGKLSKEQKRRIWRDRLPSILGLAGLWIFFAILYSAFRSSSADSTSLNVLGLAMVLSLLVAIAVMFRAWRKMYTLQVKVAAGVVDVEKRSGRYGGLFLYVDGQHFELKQSQVDLLDGDMSLAVYYVEPRKRVLSVEPIVFQEPD